MMGWKPPTLAKDDMTLVREAYYHFDNAWANANGEPDIKAHLGQCANPLAQEFLLWLMIRCDVQQRRKHMRPARAAAWYREQFPTHATVVEHALSHSADSGAATLETPIVPLVIGGYIVEELLGEGRFGRVYRARDRALKRTVAIKMPHPHRGDGSRSNELFKKEAQTVAQLNHPNIVDVYEVDETDEKQCFVVYKFIEGTDLKKRISKDRPRVGDAAQLIAKVAEALACAHDCGIVHRDIKPANIVLDGEDTPWLVDFGLALTNEDFGSGPTLAGTPAYMSPEQARGESHRVTCQSDIFSLGAVLYELLTGEKPFRGASSSEVRKEISSPRSPRLPQLVDPAVPKELERICLRAMAVRIDERYPAAMEMAADLRDYLESSTQANQAAISTQAVGGSSTLDVVNAPADTGTCSPASGIVPKGLFAFDQHDKDFYLRLLPPPFDRDGLPDSIRFWKSGIEECDANETFAVGVMYGPSGCGKSSLVSAGILPRLAEHVETIHVTSTPDGMEERVLQALRQRAPALARGANLAESLAMIRQGVGLAPGRKVLIVLDQFERWLHGRSDLPQSDLTLGMRQCDGGRLQCLVVTRDDFWMPVSRVMRFLEVPLVEGENVAGVDLFSLNHARRVLTLFGQAYGTLPADDAELTAEHRRFVDKLLLQLAFAGRVIPVQLSLLAHMIRHRAWNTDVIRKIEGIGGVGYLFLEDAFGRERAAPRNRQHCVPVEGVLDALLPPRGINTLQHFCSADELLGASGYGEHRQEFDELLAILTQDLRLIREVEPPGEAVSKPEPASTNKSQKYFQLSHDYMIGSIRDWVTRRRRSTHRGRARLLLADRTDLWTLSQHERRQLPSVLESARIRLLTNKHRWTPEEAWMMRAAGRRNGWWAAIGTVLLLLGVMAGLGIKSQIAAYRRNQAGEAVVERLADAELVRLPQIIREMDPLRDIVVPKLEDRVALADGADLFRYRLALFPSQPEFHVDYLYGRLLEASGEELRVLREMLLERGPPRARDEAVAYLQAELRSGGYREQGRGLLWGTVEPLLADELVMANGVLTRRFAFCQSMPLDKFQEVAGRLGKSGYRPVRVRPYGFHEQTLVAAIWYRDFRDWEVTLEASREDIDGQLAGFVLVDVCVFPGKVSSSEPRHCAVWVEADGLAHRKALIGLSSREYQTKAEELKAKGYRQVSSCVFAREPEKIEVSGIWESVGRSAQEYDYILDEAHPDYFADISGLVDAGLGSTAVPQSRDQRYARQLKRSAAIVQLEASDPDLKFLAARAKYYLHQLAEAIADLTELLEHDQGFEFNALPYRALAYAQLGERSKAEQDLEAALQHLPPSTEVWRESYTAWLRAEVAIYLGEEDATAPLDSLIKRYPGEPLPFFFSACGYSVASTVASRRDSDAADKYANEALKLLKLSLQHGYSNYHRLYITPDLAELRTHPAFPKLGPERPSYNGAWARGERPQVRYSYGKDPEQHLASCWQWIDGGFRPISLDVAEINGVVMTTSVWHASPPPAESASIVTRQAAVAAALLRLDPAADELWQLLAADAYPTLRDPLLNRFADFGIDQKLIQQRLFGEKDPLIRKALVLSLGHYHPDSLAADDRAALLEWLLRAFQQDSSAAVHSAIEWVLVKWGLGNEIAEAKRELLSQEPQISNERGWYVTRLSGHTMTTVRGPLKFVMGTPPSEPFRGRSERQHLREIRRDFAISTTEVTIGQIRNFDPDFSPTSDAADVELPAVGVTWYKAAAYCNWLSERAGISADQWCYEPNDGDYGTGMRLSTRYWEKVGYRLPTEAEWEYVCRAGSRTSWCFGESPELLGRYGWHYENSHGRPHAVASLHPNDYGLFDMYGNAVEWCQDRFRSYSSGDEPRDIELMIADEDKRITRGGSFKLAFFNCRSGARQYFLPSSFTQHGFRIARTLPKPHAGSSAGTSAE